MVTKQVLRFFFYKNDQCLQKKKYYLAKIRVNDGMLFEEVDIKEGVANVFERIQVREVETKY